MSRFGSPRRAFARLVSASVVGAVVWTTAPVGVAVAAATDPCRAVAGCREAKRVDVDGDGRWDRVGVVRRGEEGAEQGGVTILVRTASGRRAKTTRSTYSWFGGALHGFAALDSKPGREIVVGHTTGAHALGYRVLTWRGGRLVDLPAPSGGRTWYIDGAYRVAVGWWRRPSEPAGLIRLRSAQRSFDDESRWDGRIVTYRYTRGTWRRIEVRQVPGVSETTAYSWTGWRVPGLKQGY